MRFWRALVESGDGKWFSARTLAASSSRVVLYADQALPKGARCNLQILVPAPDKGLPARVARLRGEVSEVIFHADGIRLDFRVRPLSDEARQLIDAKLQINSNPKF